LSFDIDFEEVILSRCIRDQVFLKKAAPLLEAHHFGTAAHSWVWKTVKDIWETYHEKPNGKILVAKVKSGFTKEKDQEVHLELVRKIARKKATTAHASLAQMEEFVRYVNAQRVLEEAAKELVKNNVEKTWEILNKASRQDVKPRDYQIEQWIENFKKRQEDRLYRKENPDASPRIPTGFKRFDTILGGGIGVKELGLVMATTGRGKSITLCNLAYWAAAQGFPTVYFTLEMSKDHIAQRMDSRWTMHEYNKFKTFDFTANELRNVDKKYGHALKQFSNKLMIIETPVRKTTVPDLVRCLDDLKEDFEFFPKLVVVDSGDHMSASRRYESYRLDQADVFWGLSWMAQDGGFACWSSTQAGKQYAKEKAGAEAVSEAYDKARIADLIFSLNAPEKKNRSAMVVDEDEDEDEDDESIATGRYLELYIGKNRDGEDKVTIPMNAEFARMYINELEGE